MDLVRYFHTQIQAVEQVVGGVPKDPKLIETWLEQHVQDKSVAEQLSDNLRESGELPVTEETVDKAAKKSWTGFLQWQHTEGEPNPILREFQVKALLKEVALTADFNRLFSGTKQLFQAGAFIKPEQLPMFWPARETGSGALRLITEPHGSEEKVAHTRFGSSIKRFDFVRNPRLHMIIKVYATNAIVRNGATAKGMKSIPFQDYLLRMLLLGQEQGLGANRSMGYGKFELRGFEEVNAKEALDIVQALRRGEATYDTAKEEEFIDKLSLLVSV